MADSEPKIIVDSDWKQQAQAEKDRLAQAEKAAPKQGEGELPQPTFNELVQLLASQALMAMGSRDPQSGQIVVALELAQIHIDLLGILEEKTKGNLTDEENKMLTQTLSQLRMLFADTARSVAQAMREGKVAQTPAPPQSASPAARPATPPTGQ